MSSETIQESAPPATQQAEAAPPSWWVTIRKYFRGNLGALPVILTLILVLAFFQIDEELTRHEGFFLGPRNLNFLVLQSLSLGCLALASTLVLLIGEIDLSQGVVSYLTGAVTVYSLTSSRWPFGPPLSAGSAILLGLAVGALIGLGNGIFVAILRVPSFIVTLAGLLIYQGVVIQVLFPDTSLNNHNEFVHSLATAYFADTTDPTTPLSSYLIGIGLPLFAVLIYAGATLFSRIQRGRRGLAVGPMWATWLRIVIAIGLVGGVISLFENYLGMPEGALILMALILLFWLILRFTAYGRHVYAVGGNAEAARRAGINVTGVRISIFMLASVLAAAAGLLEVSRSNGATTQVDPTFLLNAIAAAVIGGISLFGGRGSVWGIVLGTLVIGAIGNGMSLLNYSAQAVYIVEGLVLVLAVTANSLARGQAVSVTEWVRSLRRLLRLTQPRQ